MDDLKELRKDTEEVLTLLRAHDEKVVIFWTNVERLVERQTLAIEKFSAVTETLVTLVTAVRKSNGLGHTNEWVIRSVIGVLTAATAILATMAFR